MIDSFCDEYKVITASPLDMMTDETAHQIEVQNFWWDQKCNGGKLTESMRGGK